MGSRPGAWQKFSVRARLRRACYLYWLANDQIGGRAVGPSVGTGLVLRSQLHALHL